MESFVPPPSLCSQERFVAELLGLDGSFSFSELILQKIWLRQDFMPPFGGTEEGQKLEIIHPGRWNRLAGPDFLGARLRLDDRLVSGDVELHLYAHDWDVHGHAKDCRYDSVVLHVVLFPPSKKPATTGSRGRIPTLTLLPLLYDDIESIAEDDAMERLAGFPARRLLDSFREASPQQLYETLFQHAQNRWREKVSFAKRRVERFGWTDACHQLALECLGTRWNRVPMYEIALAWPQSEWGAGRVDPDHVAESFHEAWNLRGSRPQNYPLRRLRQYAAWSLSKPGWPALLASVSTRLPLEESVSLSKGNKRHRVFSVWREFFYNELVGRELRSGKLDAFVCDVAFPLLAVVSDAPVFVLWFGWWEGCLPGSIRSALRDARRLDPVFRAPCNGLAQGLLGWSNTSDLKGCL